MTMREIAAQVAARYGLTVDDLKGPETARRYSRPRHEAMWLMKQAGRSYPQIGAFLGGRDHTTAMHGVKAHEARARADDPVEHISAPVARIIDALDQKVSQ